MPVCVRVRGQCSSLPVKKKKKAKKEDMNGLGGHDNKKEKSTFFPTSAPLCETKTTPSVLAML